VNGCGMRGASLANVFDVE